MDALKGMPSQAAQILINASSLAWVKYLHQQSRSQIKQLKEVIKKVSGYEAHRYDML